MYNRILFPSFRDDLIFIYILFLRFAQEHDLIFLETSAKTGECVEEAFLKCSKTILAKIETGELDPERIGSGNANSFLPCIHGVSCFSKSRTFNWVN